MTRPLPSISVCLLTYKRASILPRTLDSLLAQTHPDFELIVNDDCSPDGTEELCREYARRDSRVRYVRNARNLRYAGNQNAAMLRAKTDYVAIVHDGDLYRRDMLQRWTEALVEHPTAALVFNSAERLDTEGRVNGIFRHPYASLTRGTTLLDEMLSAATSPIFGIVMVRRSRVLEVGPFDPRLPVLADVDMWMRLLLNNDVAYVPEPLYAVWPREAGHQNTFENWEIMRERELIYALNLRRRVAQAGADAGALRSTMQRMLWKVRARQLMDCARKRKFRALGEGLTFVRRKPRPLEIENVPDTVLKWDECDAAQIDRPEPVAAHSGD